MRGLFMLLLLLAFALAQSLLWVIAIAQFCWLLFAGEHNAPIARFGRSLALWLGEIVRPRRRLPVQQARAADACQALRPPDRDFPLSPPSPCIDTSPEPAIIAAGRAGDRRSA